MSSVDIEEIQRVVMSELESVGEKLLERQEMLKWGNIPENVHFAWEQDVWRFIGICDGLAWVIQRLESMH